MKKYIIILFFISFHNINSQSNNHTSYDLVKKDSLFKNYIFLKLPISTIVKSNFSIYDKNTSFNSNYYMTKDTIEFTGLQNIPQNNFPGVKIDSYNPHGTNNIGASVFMGIFDWLTK
ncbi:hypothetical protein K5I29_06285 [Flavobacterium agricola]|uniref:Uncharacterized protein n=1 Tax=Flavobacterium agricola TaxID=2870839 RepID=A0ABY6M4E2_9FLAO|nr:hypothetical protein [Flavobacterium agricola]UYW02488.1 hypothetical protein K5I29_06285 [Flavobacterium agricola]